MPLAILWLLPIGCQVAPPIGSGIGDQNLKDGVYEGYFRSGPNSAVVRVAISEDRIVDVELVKHTASWKGRKADHVIPQRIISQQSTVVDAVSGATNSSRVIMNAAQKAIEKAYQ